MYPFLSVINHLLLGQSNIGYGPLLGVAIDTAYPQKPLLQAAAFQVVLKFPPYEPWKGASFGLQAGEEIRVVVVNDLIEKRFLRSAARIL